MITNYLTIDVEDYFQVAAFENVIKSDDWNSFDVTVERNTDIILETLALEDIHATFFIVGWIAERYPTLVEKIVAQGHEVGCHSYMHRKVYDFTPDEFRQDTKRCKEILEGITGSPVTGYRAPSYSITKKSLWALPILEELGFRYDSSIFPIYHDTYGIPDSPRFAYKIPEHNLIEYPISTSLFWGRKVPVAGGGYFRLFPYWFTQRGLRRINEKESQPFIFYLHPWEIDPSQPRINSAGRLSKFRHYNNLHKTLPRLKRLLRDFRFGPLPTEPLSLIS